MTVSYRNSAPTNPAIKQAEAANRDLGPYFAVPKGFIRGGVAARLGPSAALVYVALCEHRNRDRKKALSVSDRALAADTGVAERTICGIRAKLAAEKLITYSRSNGASHTYTLLPVPPTWVPIADRPRRKREPRARGAAVPAFMLSTAKFARPYSGT